MTDIKRWSGKIAVVTGASAGIGTATVEKLVENGMQVVGLARRKERLDELSKKFNQKGKFIPYIADMSKTDEIIKAFKWIEENVGPVSILVNNAGCSVATPITDGDIEAWKRIMDTNFFGLAVASREAVAIMQKHKIDGHIVNINSVAGHEVLNFPNQNVYPASKHAVTAFTETLRKELATTQSKIRVTSISPGIVATEIFEVSGFLKEKEVSFNDILKCALQPEDIANAVLYVVGAPGSVQITELTIKPTGEIF